MTKTNPPAGWEAIPIPHLGAIEYQRLPAAVILCEVRGKYTVEAIRYNDRGECDDQPMCRKVCDDAEDIGGLIRAVCMDLGGAHLDWLKEVAK